MQALVLLAAPEQGPMSWSAELWIEYHCPDCQIWIVIHRVVQVEMLELETYEILVVAP